MAEQIFYVDPGASGANDGSTREDAFSGATALQSAIAAVKTAFPSLVTSDITPRFQCIGVDEDSSTILSTALWAAGDFDATRFPTIETPFADRGANPWVWSTSRYRLSRFGGTIWAARNCKVIIRGLQVENTRDITSAGLFVFSPNNTGHDLLIEECYLRATGANFDALVASSASIDGSITRVRNSLLVGPSSFTSGEAVRASGSSSTADVHVEHCTIIGCDALLRNSSERMTVRNTLVSGGATQISGTMEAASNYNAFSGATGTGGANDRTSQTFTFENAAGGDYRLHENDAGAKGFGENLTSLGITTDYAQNPRPSSGAWDIGAHQKSVAVASAGFRPYYIG